MAYSPSQKLRSNAPRRNASRGNGAVSDREVAYSWVRSLIASARKSHWAKQHIQDFQLGLTAFYKTTPYAVGIKEDTQAGKRIYYVTKADGVPDPLTAIAADVIQNLRSPLDQVAHQLVLAACGGTEPKGKVYYPICGSAAYYPSARGGIAKHVRQEVIDAIDATEPYKGGKGHALWQLNELNNPDKHHLLVGAGAFYYGVDIAPTLKAGFRSMMEEMGRPPEAIADIDNWLKPIILRPADKLFTLNVGDELYIEPIDHEVAQDRRFSFDVSFNAPGVVECEPALKTIHDITNLVDKVVATLCRFLP